MEVFPQLHLLATHGNASFSLTILSATGLNQAESLSYFVNCERTLRSVERASVALSLLSAPGSLIHSRFFPSIHEGVAQSIFLHKAQCSLLDKQRNLELPLHPHPLTLFCRSRRMGIQPTACSFDPDRFHRSLFYCQLHQEIFSDLTCKLSTFRQRRCVLVGIVCLIPTWELEQDRCRSAAVKDIC